LTPLVVIDALRRAGTSVYAPMHRFHLEVPADTLGVVLPALARLGAVPEASAVGRSSGTVAGVLPAARVHELRLRLPALTRGAAMLETGFDGYVRSPGRSRGGRDGVPIR